MSRSRSVQNPVNGIDPEIHETADMAVPPLAELRQIVHKSESIYGRIPWISKKLIHPHVSIRFTRLLLLAGLTGNQATAVMMLTAFLGACLFFLGGKAGYIGGSLTMVLAWILDHSDGEVRRFRGEDSSFNIYMDRFTHRVSYPLMHIGTGFSLWRETLDPRYFVLGCAVAYLYQLGVALSLDKSLIQRERGDVDLHALRTVRLSMARRFPALDWPLKIAIGGFSHLIQHNSFFLLISLAAIAGRVAPFYLFYAGVLAFNFVLTVILDFTMAFRPAARDGDEPRAPSLEIQMH